MGRRVVLKEEALSVTFLIRNAVFKLKLHSCAVGRSLGVCVGENGAPESIPHWVSRHFGSGPSVCEAVLPALCRQQLWLKVSPEVPGCVCAVAAGPGAGLGLSQGVSCWGRSGGHMKMVFDVGMCALSLLRVLQQELAVGQYLLYLNRHFSLQLPWLHLSQPRHPLGGFDWEAQVLTEAGLVCFANCCLLSLVSRTISLRGTLTLHWAFIPGKKQGTGKTAQRDLQGCSQPWLQVLAWLFHL